MKPEPIQKYIVCSCCGLPWGAHGSEPSLEDCVRLLKAELAKRPILQQFTQSSSPGMPINLAKKRSA